MFLLVNVRMLQLNSIHIFLFFNCLVRLDGQYTYVIGVQETASWNPGSDAGASPWVSYVYGEKTTVVKLECSTTGEEEFEVLGEDPINVYLFRLKHKCACWDGCKDASTTTATVSTTLAPTSDACRFVHPEKGIIDFSFIGRTDEKAAYADEITRTTSNFSMFLFSLYLIKYVHE